MQRRIRVSRVPIRALTHASSNLSRRRSAGGRRTAGLRVRRPRSRSKLVRAASERRLEMSGDAVRSADGLRVLQLGSSTAVAIAALVLADNGAQVVKVEPPGGDPLRA